MLPRTPQKVIENASLTRYTPSGETMLVKIEYLDFTLVAFATK